jgi:hypothetical protein
MKLSVTFDLPTFFDLFLLVIKLIFSKFFFSQKFPYVR